MLRSKHIHIEGAGAVVRNLLPRLASCPEFRISLRNRSRKKAEALLLDLGHAFPSYRNRVELLGEHDTVDFPDMLVLASGTTIRPGQSREEIFDNNLDVVLSAVEKVLSKPETVIIVVTNPVDPMTEVLHRYTSHEDDKIIGFGGDLDRSRILALLQDEFGHCVNQEAIQVFGVHGEDAVVMVEGLDRSDLLPLVREELTTILAGLGAPIYGPSKHLADLIMRLNNCVPEIHCVSIFHPRFGTAVTWPCLIGASAIDRIEASLGSEILKKLRSIATRHSDLVERAEILYQCR